MNKAFKHQATGLIPKRYPCMIRGKTLKLKSSNNFISNRKARRGGVKQKSKKAWFLLDLFLLHNWSPSLLTKKDPMSVCTKEEKGWEALVAPERETKTDRKTRRLWSMVSHEAVCFEPEWRGGYLIDKKFPVQVSIW